MKHHHYPQLPWAIALLATLGLLSACRPPLGEGNNSNSSGLPVEPNSKISFTLENFRPLRGTPHLVAAQVASSDRGYSSLSSDYGPAVTTRNYLFFDGSRKTSHWLMPNSDVLFLAQQELTQSQPGPAAPGSANAPAPPSPVPTTTNPAQANPAQASGESANGRVQRLLYHLVKADTNDDDRLDDQDRQAIAISDPNGKNYRELLQDLDSVWQIHQHNDQTVFVFYRIADQDYVAEINPIQGQVVSRQTLPHAPQS
jgi:hypothetical protein